MNIQKRRFFQILTAFCFCLLLDALTAPANALTVGDVVYTYCQTCRSTRAHRIEEIVESPTCVKTGRANARCTQCPTLNLYAVPALGHDLVEASRTPATCTADGFILSTCSRCNVTKTETVSALGHSWSETARTSATCTTAGSVISSCTRCSQTRTETLPALGGDHTWTETSRVPATCTADSSILFTCSRCEITRTETVSALGHGWNETTRTPATCTTAGSVTSSCTRCSETKAETLPALGGDHTWNEISRTAPTCVPGSIEYTCSICQDTKTEAIPALENAHTYEVSEIIPAEYDSDGNLLTSSYIRYVCPACGDSYNSTIGGSGISGPIINEGDGGSGMNDSTAALGKTFLAGLWSLFGIYVPGFSFTFGQMWLGVLLCSISILVIRMIFGFGGGSRGDSPRTSSTNNPKISKERRHDEF